MEWVWQIPIHPTRVSVGYVATGEHVKELRSAGQPVAAIYEEKLRRFPALRPLIGPDAGPPPRTISFRCRVHRRLTGPNWVVIGEAATMIDPMTSNGVTAALRQARESADLLIRSRGRRQLPRLAALAYSCRMTALAQFFNCGIERIMYTPPVRRRIGPLLAGDVYTIPAWLMNLVYTRVAPRGVVSTCLYCGALAGFRVAASVLQWWCRRRFLARPEVCAA
jgi:flavin-dependent dehydrogenase